MNHYSFTTKRRRTMVKNILTGCIVCLALTTNAMAAITNKSGDFDAGPAQDVLSSGFMCKGADSLLEFYEKVPPMEQGREKFVDSFFKQRISKSECWEVRPSSAYLTGFRYADVKRADKKLPSLVIIPRVVVSGRIGFVLPSMLRMSLPDLVQVIRKKNEERGWPAIQLGEDTIQDSANAEAPISFDEVIAGIKQHAAMRWARPASARSNMTVVLQIGMSPDGKISSVDITKSSGDSPFDNSAVAAIKSVPGFAEIRDMKPSEFAPYRSFKMAVTPEDLAL